MKNNLIQIINKLLSANQDIDKTFNYLNYKINIKATRNNKDWISFRIILENNKGQHKEDNTYYSIFNKLYIDAEGVIANGIDDCSEITITKNKFEENYTHTPEVQLEYNLLKDFLSTINVDWC